MKRKDIKIICCLIIIALIGFTIYFTQIKKTNINVGIVEYKEKTILTFDIDKDDIYTFEGAYGKMNLEVKNSKYRVINVDCPNHNCEQMGWNDKDSLFPIVCLPNEIIIHMKGE